MRLAAIDIGTNSVHMIVVQVKPDLSFEIVDREKEMVRLGAGGLEGGRLADASQSAALDTLERFKQLAESRQVDEVLAAATSAVREARNGGEFLAQVFQRTGIRVRVISGVEEARLVHRAAVYAVEAASGTTVVIDIGGGSVEITLGTAEEVHLARSFALGVIRLTDNFVSGDPLPKTAERRLLKHIRKEAGPFLGQIRSSGFERVIATSGTSLSLGQVALNGRRLFDSERIHHQRLPAEDLHRVRKEVVTLDMKRRLRLPGLDSRRADLVVAGAVLLDTVVGLLGAGEVILCDFALREGLVLDYISRNSAQIVRADRYPDIRRRSVVELGERCRWYPDHTRQVARLALSLFDQTRGLHGLGPREREWLEFAALLHDVGGHISYIGHDEHSYYLIRNGGLRGFEPEEVETIALMARYHRRGKPKKSHPAFKALERPLRQTVKTGAAILRLAESLDRSHGQPLERIELQEDRDRFRLLLHARAPAELEAWAARRQSEAMEKLLGKPLTIESPEGPYPPQPARGADAPAAPASRSHRRQAGEERASVVSRQAAHARRKAR